jgi:mevalonate kinase
MQRFYSNGKLLLTGEYLILDGATGLALPTRKGQEMSIESDTLNGYLQWKSFSFDEQIWFEAKYNLPDLRLVEFKGDMKVANILRSILLCAKKTNSEFLAGQSGFSVSNKLEFPRNWGLGSSSTLINNIAQWSGTDPFELLFDSFGGSGYDIACARNNKAILYSLEQRTPQIETVRFDPPFSDQLFFVHLNKKQVSSESIKKFRQKSYSVGLLDKISDLSHRILKAENISAFNSLLEEHETIMGKLLETEPVQKLLFPDFEGQTKSLGAWGGDFILASGSEGTRDYFKHKGYNTLIPFKSMIIQNE